MEEIKKARNFRGYPVWQEAVDYATFVLNVKVDVYDPRREVDATL